MPMMQLLMMLTLLMANAGDADDAQRPSAGRGLWHAVPDARLARVQGVAHLVEPSEPSEPSERIAAIRAIRADQIHQSHHSYQS